MLKAIAIVAVVLAIGIAGILVFALTKPDTFRVERSLALKAPADAIYPLVSDSTSGPAGHPMRTAIPP